jgi:SAM-dependent methyltransferase
MGTETAAAEIEDHWRNAQAYDWENAGVTADFDFWRGVLDRHRPARVAELACGTGRLTLPVAEAGLAHDPAFRIVGLDYSPEMLAQARAKLESAAPDVRDAVDFVEGNMRDLPLEGQFDLIFCGFNSFAYLHTLDDQLACLTAARDHLAPGGLFALDLVVPHLAYLEEAESPVPLVRIEVDTVQPAPGVARVRRTYADRYDASTQAIATSYAHEVYFEDGRQDRWIDDVTWRMIFPRELELLLRVVGLTPLERHGSYDLTPFGPQSHQYLWLMGAAEPR